MWRKTLVCLLITVSAGISGCSSGEGDEGGRTFAPATALQQGSTDAVDTSVAMNRLGNGIALWAQDDGTGNYRIWANRYRLGQWLGPEAAQEDGVEGLNPRAIMDEQGNAVLVWLRYASPGVYHLWSRRYRALTGSWGAAVRIQSGAGDSMDPQVSVDPFGNAMVVWTQDDGTGRYVTQAIRYSAATDAWGVMQALETAVGDCQFPQVATDSLGNAVAIWMQTDGSGIYDIRFSRFSGATASWQAPGLVETDAGDAANPKLAITPNGTTFAVWHQDDGSGNDQVMANSLLRLGASWQGSVNIRGGTLATSSYTSVAGDNSGNVIALWREYDGTGEDEVSGQYTVRSARFSARTARWETPSSILQGTDEISAPELGVDTFGNAVAVWLQIAANGNSIVRGSTLYGDTLSWDTPAGLQSGTDDAIQPGVAVSNRQFLSVWLQDDGTGTGVRRIMGSRNYF